MKNIFRKSLIAVASAAIVLGTSGCKEDYLDTVPSYSFANSTVWQSPILARAALNGAYNALYQHFSMNFSGQALGMSFDSYSSVMDVDANWKGNNCMSPGNLTSSSGTVANFYKYFYTIVYRANDVINHIESVPDMDDEEKARIKAEALVLRAYGYYNLNVLWGGVPIYTENVEAKDATKPRSTKDEVWNQIIEDCTAALPALPKIIAGGETVSQTTAYAIRGFVYEFKKDYKSALADFKAIEECGAALYSPSNGAKGNKDFFQLFKPANEKNNEIIFAVACVGSTNQGNPRAINYGNRVTGGSAWNNYLPNPAYVERFEEADGSPFNWDDYIPGYSKMTPNERSVYFLRDGLESGNGEFGKYDYQAKKNQMVEFGSDFTKYLDQGNEERIKKVYENRDPRLMMAIITPYSTFNGNTSGIGNHVWTLRWPYCLDAGEPYDIRTDTNSMFYYLWRKYVPENDECTTRWVYEQNIYLIRYAEILLHRAECEAQLENLPEAKDCIDQVRKRAGHILLSDPACKTAQATKEDVINLARNEMYVELGGEDSMYFNELRWGTWHNEKYFNNTLRAQGLPYKAQSNGLMEIWGTTKYTHVSVGTYCATWPIPQKEREMNPDLTQNDGYID